MARAMGMSEKSTEEYTKKMRARYARLTGRKAWGATRRVHPDHRLGPEARQQGALGHPPTKGSREKRGAPKKYGAEVVAALKTCWLAMEQPCGKRMKDMLPLWAGHLDCGEAVRSQLRGIGAASIDRLLRGFKVKAGRKARPPKPASAVKALVEVRAQSWDTSQTGWTEVNTVAHCGGDMGGISSGR